MSKPTETVTFSGRTFTRFPLSPYRPSRVYFTAYENSRRIPGVGQLHVEVWKAANGADEIPPGHVIHHLDNDPLNNDPANLACVTRKEHARLHEAGSDRDSPEWLEHLARIRPLAAEWHRSEAGLEWHRQHGKVTWEDRETVTRTCERCGRSYEATFTERSHYCSRACNRQASDAQHRYDRRVPCPACGQEFWQNKYREKPTACSRKCAWVLRRAKAAG